MIEAAMRDTARDARPHDPDAEARADRRSRLLLILAAVITLVAWQFPIGQQVLYPFTLLATYAHEMGHGLTALLFGQSFDALEMSFDGSGLAHWHGDAGRIARGMIAAGGLVGPSIAGAIVLMLSRRGTRARALLYAGSIFMLLSVVFVARSLFAIAFITAVAAVLGLVAHYAGRVGPAREARFGVAPTSRIKPPKVAPHWSAPFFVQLIGVQLCLSVFRDVSYMFSDGAMVGGVLRPSDSAQIADALLLPYWFWGALTAAFSFAVLAVGLYVALRERREGRKAPAAARA